MLLAVAMAASSLIIGGQSKAVDKELERERRHLERRYKDFWRVIDERRQRQLERLEAGDRHRVERIRQEEMREAARRRFVAERAKRPDPEALRERLRAEWERQEAERLQEREMHRQAFALRQQKLRQVREQEKHIPPMLELGLEFDIEDLRE